MLFSFFWNYSYFIWIYFKSIFFSFYPYTINYLLVSDSMEEEAEALILKDTSAENETESVYKIVDDDGQLQALAKVFEENIGDITLEQEE